MKAFSSDEILSALHSMRPMELDETMVVEIGRDAYFYYTKQKDGNYSYLTAHYSDGISPPTYTLLGVPVVLVDGGGLEFKITRAAAAIGEVM
jgi:hypothetical protein